MYDGKREIAFVANKIIAFAEFQDDEHKTSIFVLSAGGGDDEFVVDENYRQVNSIMENIKGET